jgi:class 3 adenylate cyclase/predicted metal-dependent HD superfamily phosphohydrolase
MVQGSNNDGLWNEQVTQVKVTIVPPIWKTWWMRTIFASLAILLFWWIYRMRVRRVEKARRELEEKVEMRTQELVEKSQELAQKADELEMQKEEIMQINDQLASINEQLGDEKKKSEEMLLNILPRETAKELQEQGFYTPRHYQLASVLFTDFKSFTSIAESMTPKELIEELDYFFQYFDAVVEKHNLEKIKTIGDAYMCAGGIPKPNHTNAIDAVLAGLEIVAFTQRVNEERIAQGRRAWELRVGINSGELVAGVVGKKKFAYDIWGDAVNLASRMESSGEVGKVNISQGTYELVKDFFVCNHRGRVHAKGKGEMDMYIVEAIKPELSLGNDGLSPNAQFREMVKEVMMKANSLLHNKEEMQNFPTPLFIKARKHVEQLLTSKLPAHVVYHNWPHTWEVTEAAIEIGIAEGTSDAELEQLAIAALFHDTGHTMNYENHEEFSLKIVRQFLEKQGKTEVFIQSVTDIINATRMPQRPQNVMQRIMCDADLFYLTSELFEEKSQLLRQEWEAQFNRTYTDHAWISQNIAFLESHQYFTNYGKNALEPKKAAIVSHQKELLMQA